MFRRGVIIASCWSLFYLGNAAFARSDDGFDSIHCGSDIAKALIGKHMSNDTIVVSEKKHKDLGLKHTGADEISDRLNTVSWLICGQEFLVLEDGSVVADVIKIPEHSKTSPEFMSMCEINGKEEVVFAILDNEKEANEKTLPAKVAWKIDVKKAKFVSLSVEGLRCPRDGIITTDGGR
jgi:hypothetical protein